MMQKIVLIGAVLLSALTTWAQNTVSNQTSDPVSLVGSASFGAGPFLVTEVTDDPVLWPQRKRVKEASYFVHVVIDETYRLGEALSELSLDLTLREKVDMVPSDLALEFELNQNKAEQVFKFDFTEALASGATISFELLDVVLSTPVINPDFSADEATLIAYIQEYITVKTWYEVNYGVDVRKEDEVLCPAPIIEPMNAGPLTNRVQIFDWNNVYGSTTFDYPNYEFQLLKLENEVEGVTDVVTTTVDWSKALTLETYSSETELRLTLAQGSGFYLWRVRPIGDYYTGGIADDKNWGRWSAAPANGTEITISELSYTTLSYHFSLFSIDPDEGKNWIYNRTFTEEGNVHEGMTYANRLLQPLQSQAYSSSTNRVVTSQSVTDYLGRPALSTIPVPAAETGGLEGYKDNFLLNVDGNPYSAADFDTDATLENPGEIRQNVGDPMAYYSDENDDQSIPDAQGFPYARTIFMTDGSGRPIEQSGVGKVHAIGQVTNGSTHTTKVYYATPSDHELIAIFGDEAPPAANILKTSTVDPNGTVNVIYTTLEGKTIATAMTSISADNLEDIDASELAQLSIDADHETTVNTFENNMFISSRLIGLYENTTVTLNYSVDCYILEDMCGTPDCDYKVLFRVINQETGQYYESVEMDLTESCGSEIDFNAVALEVGESFWTKSNAALPDLTDATAHNELNLTEGYWKVQKVLRSGIDPDNMTTPSPLAKLQPLMDIVSDWMGSVGNPDEYAEFMLTVTDFNDLLANKHAEALGACGADFTTPCYQAYFDEIRSTYDLDAGYVFDPEYTLDLPTDGGGNTYVSFTAGCCESIAVDIPNIPVNPDCEVINSKISEGVLTTAEINYGELFEAYFNELLAEGAFGDEIVTLTTEWEEAFPGYEAVYTDGSITGSDVDEMVYHMLIDQYYVGKGAEVDGSWVTWETRDDAAPVDIYPIPGAADPELYGPHYTCNELYNCWIASMRAYYEMKSLKNQSFDIFGLANDELGGDEGAPAAETPAGEHYDDSAEEEGGFFDWLTGWIISKKMEKLSKKLAGEDYEGEESGFDDVGEFAYQLTIPDLFLQCSGKKIAAIVSPEIDDELNADIYTTDNYEDDVLYPEKRELAKNAEGDVISPEKLIYPYIIKPIWAFKYYEYQPGVDITVSGGVLDATIQTYPFNGFAADADLNQLPSMEIAACYHEIDGESLCYGPACEGGHHNWSAQERENFYEIIKNGHEEGFELDADDTNDPTCPTEAELLAMRNDKLQAAKDACSDRRPEFKLGLEGMLLANCYEIVNCDDGDAATVSEAELDAMAQQVVDGCVAYVDQLIAVCEADGAYPNCGINSCTMWAGNGFIEKYEVITELFDPTKKVEEKLFFIQHGDFLPAMDGIDCHCDDDGDETTTCPDEPVWFDAEIINCTSEEPTAILPAP